MIDVGKLVIRLSSPLAWSHASSNWWFLQIGVPSLPMFQGVVVLCWLFFFLCVLRPQTNIRSQDMYFPPLARADPGGLSTEHVTEMLPTREKAISTRFRRHLGFVMQTTVASAFASSFLCIFGFVTSTELPFRGDVNALSPIETAVVHVDSSNCFGVLSAIPNPINESCPSCS